ncbi:MBG domain-containing protein [Polynucleobacter necessarius]|uniref:MBG domain-containing protein n=1 Tax=Polynucleobacter necessarius TaxID=576610 RepID=UPI001E3864A3|nr:MBG domain-containing protein [Polynucleobacter necessarius]
MTANASAKFDGQSDPSFTYSLSGLKGADTSSVLSNASVTRAAGEVAGATYTLTPSATAANYTIVPVTASFTIMAQGQLLITVANASRAYGTLTAANIASAATVSASYCTIGADCSLSAIYHYLEHGGWLISKYMGCNGCQARRYSRQLHADYYTANIDCGQ